MVEKILGGGFMNPSLRVADCDCTCDCEGQGSDYNAGYTRGYTEQKEE